MNWAEIRQLTRRVITVKIITVIKRKDFLLIDRFFTNIIPAKIYEQGLTIFDLRSKKRNQKS